MTPVVAALTLALATARVESLGLATVDSRPAVRVTLSGSPGRVAVEREGDVARVSIGNAELGSMFAGSEQFSWRPASDLDPAWLAASPARLDRLDVIADQGEVSLRLRLPPEASVGGRRDPLGLLIVFRAETATSPAPMAALRTAQEPTPPASAQEKPPPPAPASPSPSAAPSPTPTADTADLARALFAPSATSEEGAVGDLYARLFPAGPPEPAQPESAAPETLAQGESAGAPLGPFRVHAAVDARFVDADTFLESASTPTRDRFLAVAPSVVAEAPVAAGRFTLDYRPVVRAFASYDQLNSSSHLASAALDLPVGTRATFRLKDRFGAGTLDTRLVDPGGEYFFGLGRFHRNDADAGLSVTLGPRLSLELAGSAGTVRFRESTSFFDYDTRLGSAGLGFELTPRLKAIASYVYEAVPRPEERPEAEARAHSGRLALNGEILPLLEGELSLGYRSQRNPNAGSGGRRFSGLTLAGTLSRQLGPDASVALLVSRATPASAFETNGFYVSSSVQATTQLPLPLELRLLGGIGYGWNDYRVASPEIGRGRADRIFSWYAGLRRPLRRRLAISGTYRREDRRSNVDALDTDSDGFVIQLEWDALGSRPR